MIERPVDTNAIATIEKVLRTLSEGPLMESMVDVPQRGATDLEIAQENKLLPRIRTTRTTACNRWPTPTKPRRTPMTRPTTA